MSHFTVLVTNTNKEYNDLEAQLEPFNEERRMPMHVRYTKAELTAKGREHCVMAKEKYDKYKKDPVAYGTGNTNHIKWLENDVPALIKALEDNDEAAFYKEGCGWYEPEDFDKDGNYITQYNDDAKWDWYQVGGRWAGFFIPKKGTTSGEKGEISLLTSAQDKKDFATNDAVDVIQVKDIDWVAMDDAEKARRLAYWLEQQEKPAKERFMWADNRDELLLMGRNQYVDQPVDHCTFAVLHNGVWYERGDMGWWGMVANKKEEGVWEKEFKKLIESLDPDTEVTVVDCHI